MFLPKRGEYAAQLASCSVPEICAMLSEFCAFSGPLAVEITLQINPNMQHAWHIAYMVMYINTLAFIHGQGMFVINLKDALREGDEHAIDHNIAGFFTGLCSGVKDIVAVRDASSAP